MSTSTAPTIKEVPITSCVVTTSTGSESTTISKSLVIKGDVTGSESLHIDGRVEGSITLTSGRVTVGLNGVAAAHINAREIIVLGEVNGNLVANDRVEIRRSSSLFGDAVAAHISIEDGACVRGYVEILGEDQKVDTIQL